MANILRTSPLTVAQLKVLATEKIAPVTIQSLLRYANLYKKSSHFPLAYAAQLRRQLPCRLARRVLDFQRLPYVSMCNPRFSSVYSLYVHSIEQLQAMKDPHDAQELRIFTTHLRRLVDAHSGVVRDLQHGYDDIRRVGLPAFDSGMPEQEVAEGGREATNAFLLRDSQYSLSARDQVGGSPRERFDGFLDRLLVTRIGTRLIAENFIRLRETGKSGVVDPSFRLRRVFDDLIPVVQGLCMKHYGVLVPINVEGDVETEFAYVPEHAHFVFLELLKNACKATSERVTAEGMDAMENVPAVTVEVRRGTFDVSVRVVDTAGGMTGTQEANAFKYGFTTTQVDEDAVTGSGPSVHTNQLELSGYGFGLGLSRMFAKYWGGDVAVFSVYGMGTEVHVNLTRLAPHDVGEGNILSTEQLMDEL